MSELEDYKTEHMLPACPSCGSRAEPAVTFLNKGPHYAEKRCVECNRHLGYIPKPDADKAKRPGAHKKLAKKFSRGFCEMCLVRESHLPKGESLEAHHVIEFDAGGDATRENTWLLCNSCHTLLHWRRTSQLHIHGQDGIYADASHRRAKDTRDVDESSPMGDVEDDSTGRPEDEGSIPG